MMKTKYLEKYIGVGVLAVMLWQICLVRADDGDPFADKFADAGVDLGDVDPFANVPANAVLEEAGVRQVKLSLEYIEMPLEVMGELLGDEALMKDDEKMRTKVGELMKSGKASLTDLQLLVMRSGTKATSESIREFIYPTEYEPAELPSKVSLGKKDQSVLDFATGPSPTAFETRNLGSTIEAEAVIMDEDQTLQVKLAPEIVYHVGNIVWTEWNGKTGPAHIQMPTMYSMRFSTSFYLKTGRSQLVASLSPKNEEGQVDRSRKVLVFAKAVIQDGK